MKRSVIAAVVFAVAALALWRVWQHRVPATTQSSISNTSAVTISDPAVIATANGRHRVPDKVRKISRDQRAQLAEALAHSIRTTTAATPSAPTPSAADDDTKMVQITVQDAMQQVIRFLSDCYEAEGSSAPKRIKVIAKLTFTGHAELGTLIETNSLSDDSEAPLRASFDSCLREAFAGLEMPPLSEGGQVDVTYPFVFAASAEDSGG